VRGGILHSVGESNNPGETLKKDYGGGKEGAKRTSPAGEFKQRSTNKMHIKEKKRALNTRQSRGVRSLTGHERADAI